MAISLRQDKFMPLFLGVVAMLSLMALITILTTVSDILSYAPWALFLLLVSIAGFLNLFGFLRGDYETELEITGSGLRIQLKNGKVEFIEYNDISMVEADFTKWSGDIVNLTLANDSDEYALPVQNQQAAEAISAEIKKHLLSIPTRNTLQDSKPESE